MGENSISTTKRYNDGERNEEMAKDVQMNLIKSAKENDIVLKQEAYEGGYLVSGIRSALCIVNGTIASH